MEFLKSLQNWKDVIEHPAETVIFAEGKPAEHLFVILSGEVELSLRGCELEVERQGGFIGEMALFESATRGTTATALTEVRLARLDRNQLAGLMNESTEFSMQLMAALANRLRAINEYLATSLEPA